MVTHMCESNVLAVLQALVNVSTVDLLYAGQYLWRAEALLPTVCTRQQYRTLRHDQVSLPSLTAGIRHATEQGDWSRVRILAQQAAAARERLAAGGQILLIADAVYGPRLLHADATTLALSGVVALPHSNLARARDALLGQLDTLTAQDTDWAAFYRSRAAHFALCRLVRDQKSGATLDETRLRQQILTAVATGDFARVKRLTASSTAEDGEAWARLCAPGPAEGRARESAAVFSPASPTRARELGLAMETLEGVGGLNRYLGCRCAERASLPAAPLSEIRQEAENRTCGHPWPADVPPGLRRSLDLLMGHPFISSAGIRYLPWFGPEAVLVETFSEDDPNARTGLLSALGLPRRRGAARVLIEDALLTNAPRVCTRLGLDPAEFTVACIPFDAYLRLAPKYGWGQRELWTHFDGYQVTRALHLRALVGGNARCGGPDDLSSLARDRDSEQLTVRFVVLRRGRFVRDARGE